MPRRICVIPNDFGNISHLSGEALGHFRNSWPFPNSVGHLYLGPQASEIFSGDLSLGSRIFGGF